jgi:4-amino-4-deoxychorismate lyase
MVYDQDTIDIEYSLHQKRDIRKLTLAYDDEISYDHKFLDRASLKRHFDNRGDADEVIIIKNGKVTDSFWANLVFFDGSKWVTPDSNLLPGVMRAYLLEQGEIAARTIYDYEIAWFEKIGLINALNPLGEIVIDAEDLIL